MKYEFKPFSYASYLNDLLEGWKATYRVAEEYPNGTPRDVEIIDLGLHAHPMTRFASIDFREHGKVRHHDVLGRFDPERGYTCLDLILYREAGPKPREIKGMAYVDADNKVVALRCAEDSEARVAGSLHPVPCTITLHEST
jgi:hypothetical protein